MKDIAAIISDMRRRENAIIILNMASDDPRAPVAQYLLENRAEALESAVRALAEDAKAEILVYAPEGMAIAPLCQKLGAKEGGYGALYGIGQRRYPQQLCRAGL